MVILVLTIQSVVGVDIERRVKSVNSIFFNKAWEEVPDKLVLYDYIGCNLFRSGPMLKGDAIVR
jgi:hypothetical protein